MVIPTLGHPVKFTGVLHKYIKIFDNMKWSPPVVVCLMNHVKEFEPEKMWKYVKWNQNNTHGTAI